MELIARLLALGVPHPFLMTTPGSTSVRLAVEKLVRERGWSEALSPADADMLVLCGQGGPEFNKAAGRVWEQLPAPRTRIVISAAQAASDCLDAAAAALRDLEGFRRLEADRSDVAPMAAEPMNKDDGGGPAMSGHADSETATSDTGSDSDMSGMDIAGSESNMSGMDMDMELPGGLPMADRGADRDGLKLDQLHLVLGPALPDWPAGLVVRLVLQGDVAQCAEISVLAGGTDGRAISSFWADLLGGAAQSEQTGHLELVSAAAAADSLQRFLSVAGWQSAARTGRRLRDGLLEAAVTDSSSTDTASTGTAVTDAARADYAARRHTLYPQCRRWLRTVRRSRLLRWSIAGLGHLDNGVSSCLCGDVTARVLRWMDDISIVLDPASGAAGDEVLALGRAPDPGQSTSVPDPGSLLASRAATARVALTALPQLLAGQELAAVRLIVASLDPDIEALQAQAAGLEQSPPLSPEVPSGQTPVQSHGQSND
ncbi:hypothetical protein [Arthrobacter sp. A5]|uniref:hypothetical protein n=1 Tax=Arthrobacter sp. A5 TaxID=576926 RepID=UPI003DA9CDFB